MNLEQKTTATGNTYKRRTTRGLLRVIAAAFTILLLSVFAATSASAHCDSYDGPVIKDAAKALEANNVKLVLKWISKEQEADIIKLFNKTYSLRSGDKEVYAIVEKHFFETLVRLHRETEGAPFTGLKPAGTTKKIVLLSDQAIETGSVDDLVGKITNHVGMVIRQKYQKVLDLSKVKDESAEKGREYVKAYIDYIHTLEGIHDIVMGGAMHKHEEK
jgi:hypothetical protein